MGFGKKEVPLKYIRLIIDMYDEAVTSVRTSGGITREYSISIDLYQGLGLNLYLFTLVMDEFTKLI